MLLRAQHVAPPAAEVHFPCHPSCAKIFLVIMSTNAKPNFKLRKILFASVIALICVTLVYFVYLQNKAWAVPEEVKKLKNPLTDGHIFYQISEGRKPMPSFKKRMTQDQRWQLVLLVRSLSQPAAPADVKPSAPVSSKPDANTKPVP